LDRRAAPNASDCRLPSTRAALSEDDSGGVDGNWTAVTTVEDVWVSNELGVILEQTFDDPRTGTSTKTVTELEKTVPDPTLFTIPSDYAVQKPMPAGPPS
jgi:hypothetical protein